MTTSPMTQAHLAWRLLGFDGEDNEVADFVDDRAEIVAVDALRRLAQLLGALTRPPTAIQQGADVDHGGLWTTPGHRPGVSRDTIGGADPGPMARGRVAQYAWSRDYHLVLRDRHEQLAAIVRELSPGARTSVYIDAGPVPERELAQRAGLGWIGKNMMLIHPEIGSFTFIGVVLTDADLHPTSPLKRTAAGLAAAASMPVLPMPSSDPAISTRERAFRI